MTTLLLGASGQLGSAFVRLIDDVVAPTHEEFDLETLTPDKGSELVESVEPDILINCAAWTAVDPAEDHEVEATKVNGTAVGLLAETADRVGIPFVTFSTDYVFDGSSSRPYRETDVPNPVNAYGRSKLAGEKAALKYPGSLVIRTSWVQSGTHPCFVRTMVELARDRDELKVVNDQIGRPTFVEDLAAATITALELGVTGLLHVANAGKASWYEVAVETLRYAGLNTRILPVSSAEFETLAKRPMNSVLDTSRMLDLGIPSLPDWQASLRPAVTSIMQMYHL